jgi:hypothetical protein
MGYQESPDYVPDPTHMSGTLDTSGIFGGGQHEDVRGVSGVFDAADSPAPEGDGNVVPNDDEVRLPDRPSPFPEGTIDASDVLSDAEMRQRVDPDAPPLPPEAYTTDPEGKPLPGSEQGGFDPAEHTVPEVKEHLSEADESEAARVLAEEEAGRQRKTLIGEFNPSEHTVEEVNKYLAAADEEERERVLDAERADRARKGIIG